MGRATNTAVTSDAGLFATSRRGPLSAEQMREIEAHRAKERPTPWQALAVRYGRCESDIKALFQPKAANDDEPAQQDAFWTDRRLQLLKRMLNGNASVRATAIALECPTSKVIEKATELRIKTGSGK